MGYRPLIVKRKKCPTCFELGHFNRLLDMSGYSKTMGVFRCDTCCKPFYSVLGEKEYRNAQTKALVSEAFAKSIRTSD